MDPVNPAVTKGLSLLTPLSRWLLDWLAGFRSPQALALRRYQRRLMRMYGTFLPESGSTGGKLRMQDSYLPLQVEDGGRKRRVEQVLADHKRVVVTGEPGAGKSMLMRHLAFEFATGGRRARKAAIPVVLGLGELATADLEPRLLDQLRRAGFFRPQRFLTRALRTGTLRILLDGLDEVGHEHRAATVQRILAFVREHDTCEVVVTCRTAVREEALWRQMHAVEVAELDDELIKQFVGRWLGTSESHTEAMLGELFSRPRVLALARVPLLLTMMVNLYARTGSAISRLPASRARFYQEVVNFLLTPWHAEHTTDAGGIDDKRTVLRDLALSGQDSHRSDWLVFDRRAAYAQAATTLDEDKGAVKDLFREIVERSGLLRQDGGSFQFAHLSFQDYLAAEALDADGLLTRFDRDPDRWQEPAVLWCGLATDATPVVEGLLRKGSLAALECLGEATEVDEDLVRSVVADFAPELAGAGGDSQVVRAFGVAASGESAAAQTVFAFLVGQVAKPGDRRPAAAHALAMSGLPEAAVVLGRLYGTTPEVREPLARMGDLAIDALAAEDALDGLAALGTSAALHKLVGLLDSDDEERAANAAWQIGAMLREPQLEAALAQCERPLFSTTYTWVWSPFTEDQTTREIVGEVSRRLVHGPVDDGPPIDPRLAIALGFIAPEIRLRTLRKIETSDELADAAKELHALEGSTEEPDPRELPEPLLDMRDDPEWCTRQRRFFDAYLRWRGWPDRQRCLLYDVPVEDLAKLFARYRDLYAPATADWKHMLRRGRSMLLAVIVAVAVAAGLLGGAAVAAVAQTVETFFPNGSFSLDAVSWLRSAVVWLWEGTAGLLRSLAGVEILFFDLRAALFVVLGIGVLWLGWVKRSLLPELVGGVLGGVLGAAGAAVALTAILLLLIMPAVWVHAATGSWWAAVGASIAVWLVAPALAVTLVVVEGERSNSPLRDSLPVLQPARATRPSAPVG